MTCLYKKMLLGLFLMTASFTLGNDLIINPINLIQDSIITIASEPDYPPFCYIDEQGKAVGFSIDLFKASAKEAGLKVNIRIGLWNQIKQDLAEGKIDALPLVGRTPEREEYFDFSLPYLSLHGAVFVRKGTRDINSIEDLKEKSIVVMKGDNAEEFVRRENISNHIATTNSYKEAFFELSQGHYDALITQRIMGLNLIKTLEIKNVVQLDFPLSEFRQDFCFAVKAGDVELLSKLNEGLSIVIANNTYQSIRERWFAPEEINSLSFQQVLLVAIYTIIPLIVLMAFIMILVLRKRVAKQTLHLNREIAEHKITFEKLNRSETQLRLILNSTAEGIYGIDLQGNCTFCNIAGLRLLGYEDKVQVIGKNLHDSIVHGSTDGTKCDKENCKILKATKAGKDILVKDELFYKCDGTFFPVEYASRIIKENDKIVGSVITFRDISELEKNRGALKELAENLEKQVDKRTDELDQKVQALDKSQTAMLYMIEDLNQMTSELKEKRFQLEISNKELEAFTYSVSHDLRSPLRAIDGFSTFLMEDYYEQFDEEGRRLLRVIRDNTIKMDQLITDLLSLSRLTRRELNLSEVNMSVMVKDIFREIASEDQIKQFELAVKRLPKASADKRLIRQVWHNLIGNALKYSSVSEKKYIEIGAKTDQDTITYYIKDMGAGFDPKYKEKLFGAFQRLHNENEFEGNGIGLAIVKRIITHHGGRVDADGKPGQGATFYFSLPKRKEGNHD